MNYLYIAGTIVCMTISQLLLKWRISLHRDTAVTVLEKIAFLWRLFFDPLVIVALAFAFLAALSWMLALSKFPLSFAYPFMSLSFVCVVLCSVFLLHEPLTAYKLAGVGTMIVGIIILSRSL